MSITIHIQLLFRRAELTVLGVSKELDNVRQREAALRETSGASHPLAHLRVVWPSVLYDRPGKEGRHGIATHLPLAG